MNTAILSPEMQQKQTALANCLFELEKLTQEIESDNLRQTISELRTKLNDPFLFVIVGEVKAGKSSFINALLNTGRDICAVSPAPCTDTIQQIQWGATESEENINQYLKKVFVPVDILKDISIVDTPGTNTIVEHHQEITERFIPNSDLIVFVFEAKNPYRQSAWQFFDYISTEWRKKIIFVLQQADLMNAEDLAINKQGVENHAKEKGIEQPEVFCVSALLEQQGNKEKSGFKPLNQFIKQNITGGNVYLLKLQSNLNTAQEILEKIDNAIGLRQHQLDEDKKFRQQIQLNIDEQEQISIGRTEKMVEQLLDSYDLITKNARTELDTGLNFFKLAGRSIRNLFGGNEPNMKEWLGSITRNMEKEMRSKFHNNLELGMGSISDSIKQMVRQVETQIQQSKTVLENNNEIFGDIADRRQDAIKAIQHNYSSFVETTENFVDKELFPKASGYMPSVATGGGLAIVGAILTATSQAAVFDITGGIFTTLGLLYAGGTLFFQKRNILKAFDTEIENGRGKLETEIQSQISAYTHKIKDRLNLNFEPLDKYILREENALNKLNEMIALINDKLTDVKAKLNE